MVRQVFFIEQEKFLREMVHMALKKEGIAPYTVGSAQDCLYLIEDIKPDLLLIDIKTCAPHREGLFDGLRNLAAHIPVVATGMPEDKELLGLYADQICAFIAKPLSPTGLGAKLFSLIDDK